MTVPVRQAKLTPAGPRPRLTFGSLFSGIGGFDLGLERAGMACAWQCEIDPKASAVLARHWPNVKRYKDVRDIGVGNLESVDLICGGFPCQDVSIIGERAGLGGQRSTLWTEFSRIVFELRPGWVVVENVVGLLSSDDGQFFGNILRDLATLGYDAEWDVLPASAFGAPHVRERVFIVAYTNGVRLEAATTEKVVFTQAAQDGRSRHSVSVFGSNVFRDFPTRREMVAQPDYVGVGYGIPGRVDRLRTLGNAVVPQVAEWLGRHLLAALALSAPAAAGGVT